MRFRIVDITAYFTLSICVDNDGADWAIALNLQRQLLFALQHNAHHRPDCRRASERCRCSRISAMTTLQLTYELRSAGCKHTNLAAPRGSTHQIIVLRLAHFNGSLLLSVLLFFY